MQTTTRCSYCKYIGHNIRQCNHPTIQNNINLIREKYATYYHNRNGSIIARSLMVNYLHYSFNLDQIRSIVVRLQIGNASVSKTNGIEFICNYLASQNSLVHLENEPVTWFVDRSPDQIINNGNRVETRVSAHSSSVMYNLVEDLWVAPNPNRPRLQGIAGIAQELIEGTWIPAYRERLHLYQTRPHICVDPIKIKIIGCNNEKQENTFDCPICLDCFDNEKNVKLNCDHIFCDGCIGEVMKTNPHDITCALCRVKVTELKVCSNDVCEKLEANYGDRIRVC